MNLYILDVVHTFMNKSIEATPTYAPFERAGVNAACFLAFAWRLTRFPWR